MTEPEIRIRGLVVIYFNKNNNKKKLKDLRGSTHRKKKSNLYKAIDARKRFSMESNF